jgi:alpha-tubulin suppressor-like RCC1 family protein
MSTANRIFRNFGWLLTAWMLCLPPAAGDTVQATYHSAADVVVSAPGYDASGRVLELALAFAPVPGVTLVVVDNTGPEFIQGSFTNLVHGQEVPLSHAGVRYRFVANYYGGTGNDLVLQWADARLLGWGDNPYPTPQRVMSEVSAHAAFAGKTILQITAGMSHQVALCADGTLIAWGSGGYGQLGDGYYSSGTVQVDRTGVLAGKTVVAVSAGQYHTVALCADGSIVTWGHNGNGQLGNNSRVGSSLPVLVDQSGVLAGRRVVSVHAGQSHTVARCADGFLAVWGSNQYSQLGNASYQLSTVPVPVILGGALAGKIIAAFDVGSNHNLALCTDGTLAAWGSNSAGQLGNGTTLNSNVPVAVIQSGVLSGKTVSAVSAGNLHSIVLCTDGTLASWGRNSTGQLGNGSTASRSSPGLVSRFGALAGKTVAALDASLGHTLAVCTDGALGAWGYNYYWQLGVNTSVTEVTSPVLASTAALRPGERFITCRAGDTSFGSFALVASLLAPAAVTLAASQIRDTSATLNGTVNGAGAETSVVIEYGLDSSYGRLATPSPAAVSGSATIAVSAGVAGLLPGRTYHYRLVATSPNGISTGAELTFTTSAVGTLAGLAVSSGKLGPAFAPDVFDYALTVGHEITSVSLIPVAADPSATLTVNGVAVASGADSQPLPLGEGDTPLVVTVRAADGLETLVYRVTVSRLPGELVFRSAAEVPVASSGFSLAGNLPPIALGFEPSPGTSLTVLENTGAGPIDGRFVDLADGQQLLLHHGPVSYAYVANYHGGSGNDLVLEWAGNRLLAWGNNTLGQLGNNSQTARLVPTAVRTDGILAGKTITGFATGEYHSLALCADGTLAAWGSNDHGQLGDNSTTNRMVPVAVDTSGLLENRRIVAIDAGGYSSVALCSDGAVLAWGAAGKVEFSGGLWVCTRPGFVEFPAAAGRAGIAAIAVGGGHVAALARDGTVYSWGENQYGQLGDGSMVNRDTPVRIKQTGILAGKRIVAVKTGSYSTYARCADGTWAAWGYNWEGQLGNGTSTHSAVPVLVDTATGLAGKTIARLFARSYHSLALCADGTLAGWGTNFNGQIGGGAYSVPVPTVFAAGGTLAGRTVVSMSPGGGASLAVCSDGTMSSWGYNGEGLLGDNSRTDRTAPVLVASSALTSGERFVAVNACSFHALAVAAFPPPVASLVPASGVLARSAVLNGTVDPKGNATSVVFEYGLDTRYGSTITATPATLSGGTAGVSASLAGLLPGTTYHYRITASNRAGAHRSQDLTFTTNRPPEFAGFEAGCGFDKPVTLSVRKLLAKAVDPDGETVAITAAGPGSQHGGAVSIQPDGIRYAPPGGFSGEDTFSVALADGRGNTTIAWITVQVAPPPSAGAAGTNPPALTVLPGGRIAVVFHGIPGRSYQLQRSTNALDWQVIATVTAAPDGRITFTDESPPQSNGFYRLALP